MVTEDRPVYKLNLEDVRTWLEMLFADADGLIHISSSGDWTGRCFKTAEEALPYVSAADAAGRDGVYVRMTTLWGFPETGGRGSEAESHYLPALWSDLDIAGPNHKTTKILPPDEATARKVIEESGLPEPTLWISTGGGLHPYWLLKTPMEITDRERVKQVSVGWQKIIAHTAKRLGYFVDGTAVADLARIMRIPGTVNRKNGAEQPCTYADGGSGISFTFQELERRFEELIPAILAAEEAARPKPVSVPQSGGVSGGLTPGDDFAAKTSWEQILVPAGWRYDKSWGGREYWTRPGKDRGVSASTGGDADVLFVFSSSTEFEPWVSYSKFGAYATMERHGHGGDFQAAARQLRKDGFGEVTDFATQQADLIAELVPALEPGKTPPPAKKISKRQLRDPQRRPLNDTGNAQRILDRYQPIVRWDVDQNSWGVYTEGRWLRSGAESKMRVLSRWTLEDANYTEAPLYDGERGVDRQGNEKEGSSEKDKFLAFLNRSGNSDRSSGGIKQVQSFEEVHCRTADFDAHTHLTNLPNGTLDAQRVSIREHRPADMLSKVFGTSYDPDADCPLWKNFLNVNLADAQTRRYLQKLVGYTLSGRASEKAMVYMYGPSDTGKSLVAQTLVHLFGDYGYSAPKGSLAPRREDKGHDPDRDGMAGKRYITTSESRPGEEMDEALIKTLTGRDEQETRSNYKDLRNWTPEGVIWVASNQYPKITGDDDAIWTRIKVIPFMRQFLEGDPDRDNELQAKLLEELPGILNWAIEGLRLYLIEGLEAAPEVKKAGEDFRTAGDGVMTWLVDGQEGEWIRVAPDEQTNRTDLYQDYKNWCSETEHRTALRPDRFYARLRAMHQYTEKTVRGVRYFTGLALLRTPHSWIGRGRN